MTTGSKRRPEQQYLSNSRNILHCGDGISRHTGGTYSHGGVMEYPRFPISELHLAKFPESMEFESWKVNFKTKVCAKTANPQITMSWITEVEKGKTIDESHTSQSILGRTDFPDCEMLDVMIASASKKILKSHIQFLKRICVEEQRAQKYDRFLRGRQISYMICEHFHAPRAYESVQGLSDLFTIRLQNNDVQDLRCQMLSGTIISRWTTFGYVPGRIVEVKIKGFCSVTDCVGSVWSRNGAKQKTNKLFKIENISEIVLWPEDEKSEP